MDKVEGLAADGPLPPSITEPTIVVQMPLRETVDALDALARRREGIAQVFTEPMVFHVFQLACALYEDMRERDPRPLREFNQSKPVRIAKELMDHCEAALGIPLIRPRGA